MSEKESTARGELYGAIESAVQRGLKANGISEEAGKQIALECVAEIKRVVGGKQIYFPFGTSDLMSHRNKKLYSEFTGSNFFELSRKYKISEMRVRQIVALFRVHRRKGESF